MVFDEASSWCSPQKIELSKSRDLEEVSKDNKESEEQTSNPNEERELPPSKDKSSWKTIVHQHTFEELHPSQMEVNEHRKEMAGVLNETTSKCSQQCEVSSNSLFIELLILKEENKALREKVKMVHGKLKNMRRCCFLGRH
ncbi:hypothetical protein V6N13_025246 [Hibiscus sabdariffa]